MPLLSNYRLAEGDSTSHGRLHMPRDTSASSSPSGTATVWIIIAVVAAILALGSGIALVVVSLSKRRMMKQQLEEARRRDPCLARKEFSKKRRMTHNDLTLEAEEQREAMIRKSLASRMGRPMSMSSQLSMDSISMSELPGTSFVYRYGPREEVELSAQRSRSRSDFTLYDEKSWEAGHSSRPSSSAGHQLARSDSPIPNLPAPTLSRSSSPSRMPQVLAHRPEHPPSLEQHPLFQRLNEDSDTDGEHR